MAGLALETIWRVVGEANRFVDATGPWVLARTDKKRMGNVLYVLAETIRRLAILVQPFVPEAAERLLDQLAVTPAARNRPRPRQGQRLRPARCRARHGWVRQLYT